MDILVFFYWRRTSLIRSNWDCFRDSTISLRSV